MGSEMCIRDRNNSAILRAAIQSYGMKLKVGETKYIYGSVNLQVKDEYDNDCLLYTSPSPRDGLLSRMPSSA